jgi:hypothetical protein
VLSDDSADPSHYWAVSKHYDKASCTSLDELMDMIGLKSVKRKAQELFTAIYTYVCFHCS